MHTLPGGGALASPLRSSERPRLPGTSFLEWANSLYPEGGSERKKMTPFEDLGILLQSRWSARVLLSPRVQER